MKRTSLTMLNAGIAFIMAFIISQFTSAIGVQITEIIFQAIGLTASKIEKFWETSGGYLLQSLYMNLAFVGIFIWYFKYMKKQDVLNKPNKSTLKYFAVCLVVGIISMFLLSGTLNYFNLILDKLKLSPANPNIPLNSTLDYILCLISLAVIPAVCEELLFRGVFINCLKHKGQIFAIVASSIMFSIFHFSLLQLIYPICFGLILGIIYLRTRNIIFPIIIHFINNALSLTIQYFSTNSSAFSHSEFMLGYTIITFALWLVAMFYMFKDFIKYRKESNQSDDTNIVDNQATNKINNLVFYGSIAIMLCLYTLIIIISI